MTFLTEPSLWNFYRLGPTREKDFFKRNRDTYTGIIIPAHIATYYSKFSHELLSETRKPYFIDPLTFIFARDPILLKRYLKDKNRKTIRDIFNKKKRGDTKASFKKLAQVYEGVILESVKNSISVKTSDFSQAEIDSLTKKVVDFQLRVVAQLPDKYKKYSKYTKETERENLEKLIKPEILIPPYFYFDQIIHSGWLGKNIEFIQSAKTQYPEEKIFPIISTNINLLEKEMSEIIKSYNKTEVDGYIIWVDKFVGIKNYDNMIIVKKFINELSKSGKPIILLYSDAIGLLLYYYGLTGFSCGICYGESKSVDQDLDLEGEIPPRYYIPSLKIKIQKTEAERIDFKNYPEFICNCKICSTFPNPAVLDDEQTKDHFMRVRFEELMHLRGMSVKEFKKELLKNFQAYKNEALLPSIKHLADWYNL